MTDLDDRTDVLPRLETDSPAPRGWLRRRWILVTVALVVVLAGIATWVVAFSSLLGVRSVVVRGTSDLTPAQVVRAADIVTGTPLVRLDTAGIVRRVEALPLVESAAASTSFPSTVTITVVERTPVGYLPVGHGRDVLVDRTGARFETVGSPPAQLPRIVLARNAAQVTVTAVAQVAADLPRDLLPRVRSIQAMDPLAITLVARSGVVVHWGSSADSVDKARVLPALMRQAHAHGAGTIDVSDPQRPFTH